ncbi:MAG: ABC transporter permease [Desulfobulbaceae bacterium]|nr:ABC transporter permease [Desulfobulbaceae bacterium]
MSYTTTINLNKQQTGLFLCLGCLSLLFTYGVLSYHSQAPELASRFLAPCLSHPFGTDWLGRDMLIRTMRGLGLSLRTGLIAAFIATIAGTIVGIGSGIRGGRLDAFLTWLMDIFMSLPHIVLLILLSFAVGGGLKGAVFAVAASHWPRLARVIRMETLQVRQSQFVRQAEHFGKSPSWIAYKHILPNVIPQAGVGFVLLFPHALAHEAGLSFLGLGLPPHLPAVGVLLADSMRHLATGRWWLALLPGLSLLAVILIFDHLGHRLQHHFGHSTREDNHAAH